MFETELAHTEKRMKKSELLKELLSGLGSLAVAFSGGVDSTFLLRMAREALGDKAVAITAVSDFFPARERSEAADFCAAHGIRQLVVPVRACDKNCRKCSSPRQYVMTRGRAIIEHRR